MRIHNNVISYMVKLSIGFLIVLFTPFQIPAIIYLQSVIGAYTANVGLVFGYFGAMSIFFTAYIFSNEIFSLLYMALIALPPIFMGHLIKKGKSPYSAIIIPTFLYGFCEVLTYYYFASQRGKTVAGYILGIFNDTLKKFEAYALNPSVLNYNNAITFIISKLLVGFILIFSLCFIVTTYYIVAKKTYLLQGGKIKYLPFTKFKLDRSFTVFYIILLGATYFLSDSYIGTILLNMSVFVSFIFVIEGLSVIMHYFRFLSKTLHKSIAVLLIALSIVFVSIMTKSAAAVLLVLGIGVLDSFICLKRW